MSSTYRPRRFIVNSFGCHADVVNRLHRLVSRLWPATPIDALSVPDAVEKVLARLGPRDRIRTIQFWGHGRPGAMCVGDEELQMESFAADHPHFAALSQLLPYLADDAVLWFRGCQTFAGRDGKNFASRAVAFFGRHIRVVGQTRLIGYNLDWGGAVWLWPKQSPNWPDLDLKNKALKKEGDGLIGRVTRLLRRAGSWWRQKL
jgi:hypothetical protein